MKNLKTTVVFLLALATSMQAQAQVSITNFIEKTGGASLYNNISTYDLLLTSNENNIATSIKYIVDLKAEKIIQVKSIMGKEFVYTLMDNTGNLKIPMGRRGSQSQFRTQSLSEPETDKLRARASEQFYGFINYKENGFQFLEESWSKDSSIVTLKLKSKLSTNEYYFNAKTSLLTKEVKNYTSGEVEEFQYENYGKVAFGILFPKKVAILDLETKKLKVYDSSLEINKPQTADFARYK